MTEDDTAAVGAIRIYVFKSETARELHAFSGDPAGLELPSQFKPWRVTGAIAPDGEFPYKLPRKAIEAEIRDRGYQLWRTKKAPNNN